LELKGKEKTVALFGVKFLDGTPKAKERNSGVIMDEISFAVQVQIVGAGEKLFSQATALVW